MENTFHKLMHLNNGVQIVVLILEIVESLGAQNLHR